MMKTERDDVSETDDIPETDYYVDQPDEDPDRDHSAATAPEEIIIDAKPSNFTNRPQAVIWQIFEKLGNNLAKCSICEKELSTFGGNTTTMRRHASRFHVEEW